MLIFFILNWDFFLNVNTCSHTCGVCDEAPWIEFSFPFGTNSLWPFRGSCPSPTLSPFVVLSSSYLCRNILSQQLICTSVRLFYSSFTPSVLFPSLSDSIHSSWAAIHLWISTRSTFPFSLPHLHSPTDTNMRNCGRELNLLPSVL